MDKLNDILIISSKLHNKNKPLSSIPESDSFIASKIVLSKPSSDGIAKFCLKILPQYCFPYIPNMPNIPKSLLIKDMEIIR